MGFRFEKRVSTPLGRINFSKSGVSLTEGVPGAQLTIGRKSRITFGIPGSGISWTERLGRGAHRDRLAGAVGDRRRRRTAMNFIADRRSDCRRPTAPAFAAHRPDIAR
jgi:hypothetical protein